MDRKKIGRYEILGELGRGAMGAVLRARDPAMGREVALKCILSAALASDQMAEFRERFYREARAAGALAHPGIVPVFDVGEDEGVPFLVMELVQGHTLDSGIKKGERYSLERVCEIGQQIADALGYAHRSGVIHRDIKPANILMTSREIYGAERPRITDFGVAKLEGGEATTTRQLLGTPAFMPPEQFTGSPIDGRTDLFSLGVILYRMTTGEQPFPGETLTAVSYKVVHTEPIAPSRLNPAISQQLELVILKCLAKSPADRYQTGDELAADLAAIRSGPRASGRYATVTQAIAAPPNASETINQVGSLRPRQVSATVPAAPPRPSPPVSHGPVLVRPAASVAKPDTAGRPADTSVKPARPTPIEPSMIESSMISARSSRAATAKQVAETAPAKKRGGMGIFAWLIFIGLAVGGTWLLLQLHVQQSSAVGADASQLATLGGAPEARVDFNPKTLDPNTNARLNFNLDTLPSALSITVQMDGKVYWSGIAGDRDGYEGLLAPPGRHVLRVVVSGGGAQKASGSISGDFVARKKMTLTVKLFPPNNGAFDPLSDVVITLSKSLFPL